MNWLRKSVFLLTEASCKTSCSERRTTHENNLSHDTGLSSGIDHDCLTSRYRIYSERYWRSTQAKRVQENKAKITTTLSRFYLLLLYTINILSLYYCIV